MLNKGWETLVLGSMKMFKINNRILTVVTMVAALAAPTCGALPTTTVTPTTTTAGPTTTEVVYTFTVDGDVIGGTITIDVGSPADSSGGVDTYILGDGVTAFSLYRDGSVAVFDQTDDIWDFFVELATSDDTPISLMIDCDDTGGDYIFADPGFDFGTGLGQYEPGDVSVTGAALTPESGGPPPDGAPGTLLYVQ